MAKGGYRPGAGRPKGSKSKSKMAGIKADTPLEILSPLEFLLQVMRDDNQDTNTRLRAASLAAPYLHPRAGDGPGKKEDAKERAKRAASGIFAPGKPPIKLIK